MDLLILGYYIRLLCTCETCRGIKQPPPPFTPSPSLLLNDKNDLTNERKKTIEIDDNLPPVIMSSCILNPLLGGKWCFVGALFDSCI